MKLFGSKGSGVLVTVFGKTDVGRTREHNEDCFMVADLSARNASLQPEVREHEVGPRGSLLVVADGMGGAAAGEVASEMASRTIYEHMVDKWGNDEENTPQQFAYRLKEAVEEANTRIHAYAKEHPEMRGMGTTTTAVGVLGDHLYITQVGDSRAYLVRRGRGIQLTKDQSLMQRLVDAGEITEEEAERSERRNIILQALGPDAKVRVDLTNQQVRRGDALVLCSDGLSGQVSREEITERVSQLDKDLVAICSELIDTANERGGPDNITVVIAKFGGDGLGHPGGEDEVGHQVYPLLDPESTTEPVPVYKGSPPPVPENRARLMLAGVLAAGITAAALFFAAMGL
ncbi:MAG: Stp1/IreP family PP2C-type Ser/Thr phosphatase [Gemmatimonadales bacterium]|nr:Stp1/IreP family PP2C-type Ser/Thr phosphatase [Gemmatimonadales bacterium]NIN11221.1 Stp1/IreP family PP2C-type Ser/Thr phosphatase [Gemmatimonadales bacterium]NIN49820.1 Stp1/IreP family PP2C-type Ser/Thr phosphatase [Gemmatimonadales bacterium]NIP07284.1 Stp1/IreP family PP2C-type Ser/Thr phosphatase [Gemmatimonadales bacterium]NIR02979.1 Stp1/IreP family PP2C-type Ser/Thr phosphatase [Gemmatimonadales bacterium]